MIPSPPAATRDPTFEAVYWAQTIMRSAVSVTMLMMAAHHILTWNWFNTFIHDRFDPVFGHFVGKSAGHALVGLHTRLQTTVELLVSIPLLAGIGLRRAATGVALVLILNVTGLSLEEIINPGDEHAQRLQVLLWNHLQFLMALGVIATTAITDYGARTRPATIEPDTGMQVSLSESQQRVVAGALLLLRVLVGIQMLLPALSLAYAFIFDPSFYYTTQSYWFMPQLTAVFPALLVLMALAALGFLSGTQTRLAAVCAAAGLLFMSSQFLLHEKSQLNYSLYFKHLHFWNLAFMMFIELALIALGQPLDHFTLARWWPATLGGQRKGEVVS